MTSASAAFGHRVCDQFLWMPRHHVANRLSPGHAIVLDGSLEDHDWSQAKWTDLFTDIQGPLLPAPRKETRAKMLWDDTHLYIAAVLQEDEVWANQTVHDSVIFHDNDFEVFIDPDASCQNYKEIEVNALATTWDLALNRPYSDSGSPDNSYEGGVELAVAIDGKVNDPSVKSTSWTVEMRIPHDRIILNNSASMPKIGDVWRINFSRVEWRVLVKQRPDGTRYYAKDPAFPAEDNWVWTPQLVINMHAPEKWGFMQFGGPWKSPSSYSGDPHWVLRSLLIEVFYASRDYSVNHGGLWTSDPLKLTLSDHVRSGSCGIVLQSIVVADSGATVLITMQDVFDGTTGTIDQYRHIRILK